VQLRPSGLCRGTHSSRDLMKDTHLPRRVRGRAHKRSQDQVVEITRPEKVLFPGEGITKRDLVEYYERIAPIILPYLQGRAIGMERYPDGITGQGFFQKKAGQYFPRWIETASLAKQNGTVRHVICNDPSTLAYLANQAVITPHTWLSCIDKPNHPDQMIFDLDPSADNFRAVCAAAKKLRELLKERGLTSFVKTTGSRGLHVLVPLDRKAEFDEVRAFAREIAQQLVESNPKNLTTDVRKSKRGDRIFVDTGRNSYAQTAVPPYAVRARDGAPVAAPLTWDELEDPKLRADRFSIRNIFDRLADMGNPWKNLEERAKTLPR
jgi:bifunctional non-homologous end joining protein LigD